MSDVRTTLDSPTVRPKCGYKKVVKGFDDMTLRKTVKLLLESGFFNDIVGSKAQTHGKIKKERYSFLFVLKVN